MLFPKTSLNRKFTGIKDIEKPSKPSRYNQSLRYDKDPKFSAPLVLKVEDEVDNQRNTTEDMEGVEEEIPRNETEPGKPICGNPNQSGAETNNLVGNYHFIEVDPRVVTKLFLCPLCFCKLAYRKDAENHVFVHHKIDAAMFQDLNLNFGVMEV